MSFRVTVVDEQTGETVTVRVATGDYLLIAVEPCFHAGVQAYPNKGTHVITIKGHNPQPLPEVESERESERVRDINESRAPGALA